MDFASVLNDLSGGWTGDAILQFWFSSAPVKLAYPSFIRKGNFLNIRRILRLLEFAAPLIIGRAGFPCMENGPRCYPMGLFSIVMFSVGGEGCA